MRKEGSQSGTGRSCGADGKQIFSDSGGHFDSDDAFFRWLVALGELPAQSGSIFKRTDFAV